MNLPMYKVMIQTSNLPEIDVDVVRDFCSQEFFRIIYFIVLFHSLETFRVLESFPILLPGKINNMQVYVIL